MSRVAFPIQTFTNAEGQPLSFGYLLIRLSQDAQTPDTSQIAADRVGRVELDTNGDIAGNPTFWANANLVPSNTVYLLSGYTSAGELVFRNVNVTVTVQGFGLAFGSSFGS